MPGSREIGNWIERSDEKLERYFIVKRAAIDDARDLWREVAPNGWQQLIEATQVKGD